MKIRYTIDNSAAKTMLVKYPIALQQGMVGALNKTVALARTQVSRRIRQPYGLPVKALSGRAKGTGLQKLAVQNASLNNPTAFIIASSGLLNLILFGAKQTGAGIVHTAPYAIVNGAKTAGTLVPHGFIAIGRSKTMTPFIRIPGARRPRPSPKRFAPDLPISVLKGPSVADLFELTGGEGTVLATVTSEYPRVLESELSFRLSQLGIKS